MSSPPTDRDSTDEPVWPSYSPGTVEQDLPHADPIEFNIQDLSPAPYISRSVLSVVGADIGLGLANIEKGLYITFERWRNFNVGDIFQYYIGANLLAWDEVRSGQEGATHFQLSIAYGHVPTGFLYPCYGRVLRIGGTESTSIPQTFFIKNTRPGGVDTDPGMAYHSELKLHLPEDLQGPDAVLEPDRARQGVLCTIEPYPEIRVRDTVELEWNSQIVTLQLDDDHANGFKPIEIFVPEGVISRAGSGLAAIRFLLRDEVRNFSGPIQQWSKTVHLQVDLDPNLLQRPYFLVDRNDTFDINFDTQGEARFEVEVVTPRVLPNGSAVPNGTQIVVTLAGTQADGTSLEKVLPPFPATIGRSAFTDVENDFVKQLINGSMRVSYELQFPLGTRIGASRAITVTVFGTQSNMPAVTIVEALDGFIDPTIPTITVNFPEYTPYNNDFPVKLRMELSQPGGGVLPYEQTLRAGPPPPPTRFRIVQNSKFQPFVGRGHVRVFYQVDDGKVGASDLYPLKVRDSDDLFVQFGRPLETMPKPLVQGVDPDGNLDPNDVIGQAIVTLPYSNTQVGETFVWRWVGSNPGGTTGDEIKINLANEGTAVSFAVDKAYVDANLDGEIRLSYALRKLDGTTLYSEVLVISVGRPIGDLLRPEVQEASRHPDRLRPEDATAGATIVVYFHQMLATDRVRAVWTGIPDIGSHTDTKNGNDSHTVSFRVPSAVVGANITASGRSIQVQYFLIRRTRESPSPILDLQLLPLTTLPIPTIEGVGDNPVLNTSSLSGSERTVIVPWYFIHTNQYKWMELEGERADGQPYFETIYNAAVVTADEVTNGVTPATPVNALRQLKDGTPLVIRFWVSFDRNQFKSGAVPFTERRYLIQTLPGILPHPFINGASGTGPSVTVEPLTIQHDVRVTVKYSDMRGDDLITLRWVYQNATSESLTLSGLAGGSRDFTFNSSVLARSVNTTVQLSYSVVRTGIPGAVPSHVQTVRVNTIAQASLPRPLINNVPHNSTLNVPGLPTWALLTVAQWPLQYSGMRKWLTLRCQGASPDPYVIWAGEPHNSVSAVEIPAPLAWLATCPNGERLSIDFRVGYVANATQAQAIPFPVTEYPVINTVQALSITGLTDSLGRSITNDGYAATSTVTISGTATPTPRSAFDLYDGDTLIRNVPAGATSAWSVVLTGVSLGQHRYQARGTSGNPRPVSNIWSFNNLAVITPTIAVYDSRGVVLDRGRTTDTTVTYRGTATPRLQVQMFENGTGRVLDVNTNGDWSYQRTGLTQRTYSVSVKALYANVESATQTFTVGAATQPLVIDQSTMHLNGYAIVAAGWVRNGQDYPGNAQTRTPSGGQLPYRYSSRNDAVASVNSAGKVTGNRNGSTTIDVQDNLGSAVSYSVSVSNVWHLRERRSNSNHHGSILWRNSMPGAVGVGYNLLQHMQTVYGPIAGFPFPAGAIYWCCLEGGCGGFLPENPVYDSKTPTQGLWCIWVARDYWAFCLQP